MNIFIGENNLKDYVFLKSIIEKWGIERQQEIYFHWYKQLYYQLPKCLKNCDLVFLELDMKHINGFEFAKILRKKDLSIPIVFQTKNTHYGIASYQVQAMHYLLKPLDQQEIYKILDCVLLHQHSKTFIYQFKKEVHKIPYEDIIYIEAYQHHVMIHQNDMTKRNYLSLKEIALQLDDSFCRCHRSYIVNLKYVERIEGMNCITKNKQVIPISKKYKNDFIEKNNKEFKNGDFIELQGEFSINPLIDLLNTFSNFFEMSGVINKAANTSKAKNKRTEALKDVQIESQIKGLIKVFETDGKIDVICHSEDKTFIIPSKKEFFTDGKGDVIRTGNFRMLGKIVKICSEKENISLLRDTKIGKIKNSILDTAIESFNDPEIKNVVDFETVVTNYDNAILVYPIAIYI